MQDSLKIFIQQHRAAFDQGLPGAPGWSALQKILDRWPAADRLERTLLEHRLLLDTAAPGEQVWTKIETELSAQAAADPLEQFIKSKRHEFDTALPNAGLWASLETSLPTARPIAKKVALNWQKTLVRAAAAVLLLATGAGMGIWYTNRANQNGMAMGEVSPEYRELEQFYQRDINAKQRELATFTGNQAEEVHDDLQQIDVAMQELRAELADVPPGNREQVVRAMIENYKAKMAILQRVLERLEPTQTDQNDKKYHETKHI